MNEAWGLGVGVWAYLGGSRVHVGGVFWAGQCAGWRGVGSFWDLAMAFRSVSGFSRRAGHDKVGGWGTVRWALPYGSGFSW